MDKSLRKEIKIFELLKTKLENIEANLHENDIEKRNIDVVHVKRRIKRINFNKRLLTITEEGVASPKSDCNRNTRPNVAQYLAKYVNQL